jgi:PD-(D/E)XK nuclease superfamily
MSTTEKVRQSFAATYDNCPHAAFLSLEEGDFSTHAQARGTIMHTFAQRVIEECIANQEKLYPTEMAKPLMVDVIQESGLPINAPEFDTLMALAWKFCSLHQFEWDRIVDLEETYSTEINGVLFTGKPDVVEIEDRVATVRDWKTGWAIDPETELRGSFQGRSYAKQIFAAYPQIHTVVLVWEYQRWDKQREVTLTRSDLADIDAMLETLMARITRSRETGEWPASPGKWCALCPAAHKCPIPDDYRGDGHVTSPESAQQAADLLVALGAVRTAAKKSLRAWCGEHGPQAVGDLVFDFKAEPDFDKAIDKNALREAMSEVGLEWRDHFKLEKGSTKFAARKVEA